MQSYIKTKFAQIFLIFDTFKIHSSSVLSIWSDEVIGRSKWRRN